MFAQNLGMSPHFGRVGRPPIPREPINFAALKAARIERGMSACETAEELTRRCGRPVREAAYWGWERGEARPPNDARAALEAFFGIALSVEA